MPDLPRARRGTVFSLMALGVVAGLGFEASSAARRVPIGRFTELSYGAATVDPSRMAGFRPARDARSAFLAPPTAPRQVFGYEVGRPPIRPLVVNDSMEVFALARETLHRVEPSGIGEASVVSFMGGLGFAALSGGGFVAVDRDGLHYLDALLREERLVQVSHGVTFAPLALDDGSVVVAGGSGVSRFDEAGRELFRYTVATRIRSWVAARSDRSLVFATDRALVVLSPDGDRIARVPLVGPILDGPAVALDGGVWVVTGRGAVRFDRGFRAQTFAWPDGIGRSRAASLAVAADGSARIAIPGRGVWSLTSSGRELFFTTQPQRPVAITVDAAGNSLVATGSAEVALLDPAGALQWRASIGLAPSTRPVLGRDGLIIVGTQPGTVVALR